MSKSKKEKKENIVEDEEPLVDESETLDKATREVLGAIPGAVPPEEPPKEPEPDPEPWPPFRTMIKTKTGPTVKERVPKFRDKVLKLYKKMKYGEHLTTAQFAKRLRLKDPDDIQAAGIAWANLFDEGKIVTPDLHKPLRGDSLYKRLEK